MTDEAEYARQLDREQVAHARKSWPDPAKVRRVRIYDGEDTPHQMAQAVRADHERERRGADDGR